MRKLNGLDWIALMIVLVGAVAWGLMGFINYDAIWENFGDFTTSAKLIYDVMAISGLYLVISLVAKRKA